MDGNFVTLLGNIVEKKMRISYLFLKYFGVLPNLFLNDFEKYPGEEKPTE